MKIDGGHFLIKQIDETQLSSILEVYRNCEDFLSLGPVPYASIEMVLADLKLSKEENRIYCGIFVNDEMIGVVDFILCNYEDVLEHAYISLLMISLQHRDKGLGTAVINAVEKEILKNNKIQTIFAGVQTNNLPAIHFWTKLGYKIISGPELLPDKTIVYGLNKEIKK